MPETSEFRLGFENRSMSTVPLRCRRQLRLSRMKMSPAGNPANHVTAPDLIFRLACLILGVQTGFERKLWLDCVIVGFWFVQFVSFSRIYPLNSYANLVSSKEKLTMCEMITAAYIWTFSMAIVYTAFSVRSNRDIVEPLLRKNGRRNKDVVVPIVCGGISIAWSSKVLTDTQSWVSLFMRVSHLVFKSGALCLFLIYTDVTSNIIDHQTEILASLRALNFHPGRLIAKKWNLRERISNINSVFALSLIWCYLTSFMTVIYYFGSLITKDMTTFHTIFLTSSVLGNVFQLFDLARKCSAFKSCCIETDRLLLMLTRSGKICKTCHTDLSAVLRFRKEWDVLKVGYFSLDVETFFKFLATGVTCVAVILQFDYKVVRSISALSKT